jgi:hypothetical protein
MYRFYSVVFVSDWIEHDNYDQSSTSAWMKVKDTSMKQVKESLVEKVCLDALLSFEGEFFHHPNANPLDPMTQQISSLPKVASFNSKVYIPLYRYSNLTSRYSLLTKGSFY